MPQGHHCSDALEKKYDGRGTSGKGNFESTRFWKLRPSPKVRRSQRRKEDDKWARWYSPTSARFNRLDPFFGNLQDPLSLHKYLYVHGDPVEGVDPSGLLLGSFLSFSFMGLGRVATAGVAVGALVTIGTAFWLGFTESGREFTAHWTTPATWPARATGARYIRAFSMAYDFNNYFVWNAAAADLDAALDRRLNPVYRDADMHALFEEYARLYPYVTSRRCDLALEYLVNRLKLWVNAHPQDVAGITFIPAALFRPDAEDDNLLVLVPNEFVNENDLDRMRFPVWYDTPRKRDILYFYPGSAPVRPIGKLYSDYISKVTRSTGYSFTLVPDESFPGIVNRYR